MHESSPQIAFFSGLGADARLFVLQKLEFPNLLTPQWLPPLPDETLDDYIDRWSQMLKLTSHSIVGGASFGGLIAQRLAERLGARHCLLFGSIQSAEEIPLRIKIWRPIHKLAFAWVIRFWQIVTVLWLQLFGRWMSKRWNSVLKQFSSTDPHLIKWSVRQFFLFFESTETRKNLHQALTIHQIHGTHDRLFPLSLITGNSPASNREVKLYPIEDAGHLLTLTHSQSINKIIQEVPQVVAPNPVPAPD